MNFLLIYVFLQIIMYIEKACRKEVLKNVFESRKQSNAKVQEEQH